MRVRALRLGCGDPRHRYRCASTTIFSVFNAVLLRPLPYEDPERLVNVWRTNLDWMSSEVSILWMFSTRFPASYPVYEAWVEQNPVWPWDGG